MSNELIAAIKSGDITSVNALLEKKADVNSLDADGFSPLMLAAHQGNLPMVDLLIEHGAEVNARTEQGWTALSKAVYNAAQNRGFADVVHALISAGANIEAPIGYGVRPLMLAAGYGETAVVEELLKAGADVKATNDGGMTALMMVKQKNYIDVINLLHEAEQLAGIGEGNCNSKNPPGSNVVTFMKRPSGK